MTYYNRGATLPLVHHYDTCFDSIYCFELSSYITTIYAAPLVVTKQTYQKRAETENVFAASYELIQGLTLPKLLSYKT